MAERGQNGEKRYYRQEQEIYYRRGQNGNRRYITGGNINEECSRLFNYKYHYVSQKSCIFAK